MPFHRGAPHGRPPLKQWGVEDAAPYEILSKNGMQGSASRMTRATLALHFLQYVQCVIVRPVRTPAAPSAFPHLIFISLLSSLRLAVSTVETPRSCIVMP